VKKFRIGISKLVLAGLVVFGFGEIIFADEMFASVESKAYKNYYHSQDYHTLKGEYNLDNPNFSELSKYSAEAFISLHIYSVDKVRDINEEFQFGTNNKAILLEYINKDNALNGFTAGIYLVNRERLVVAFGGTTANESYSKSSSIVNDVLADLNLLNNTLGESSQVSEARLFIENIYALMIKYNIEKNKVFLTGHSLGGGLAQYISIYKGFTAITFNTAPNPLTYESMSYLRDDNGDFFYDGSQNINFMTNNDELTSVLKVMEIYAKTGILVKTGNLLIDVALTKGLITKLKILMLRPSPMLTKLIYGQRIVLNTNTKHSMVSLINSAYTGATSFKLFKNSFFTDIRKETPLYDAVFSLIKNHSISYPKQERQYKFYPNEYVTGSEFAIFFINTFYYKDFREEQAVISSETRFAYLGDKFGDKAPLHFTSKITIAQINDLFELVFIDLTNKELDNYTTSWYNNNISKTKMKKKLLKRFDIVKKEMLIQGDTSKYVTRGQFAIMLMKFNNIDIKALVKEVFQSNHKSFIKWFFKGLVSLPNNITKGND